MSSAPKFLVIQPWYQRRPFQLLMLGWLPLIWAVMLWQEGWQRALGQAPVCLILPIVLLAVDRRRTPTLLERKGDELLIHSPLQGVGLHLTRIPLADVGLEWIGAELVLRNLAGEGLRDCLMEARLGRGEGGAAAAAWLQAQGVRPPVGR